MFAANTPAMIVKTASRQSIAKALFCSVNFADDQSGFFISFAITALLSSPSLAKKAGKSPNKVMPIPP